MTEISGAHVYGMQIADGSLAAAQVRDVEVVRANVWRVRVRGAWIGEVSIDGEIAGLRINGVDVGPLIETSGRAARSSAIRRRGIRSACRSTRWSRYRASRGTGTPDPA